MRSISIIGMLLLIVNLLTLRSAAPAGYVIDIYSMLPGQYYAFLIICYFIGSLLLLTDNKKMGVFILILVHLEILAIPYMLGYYSMGRFDDMTYIGEYRQISDSCHIAEWDIYPASHILGSVLSMAMGLPVNLASFIIPALFSYLFIAGLILFSARVFNDRYIYPISIASSFILYLGPYNFLNTPHALFFAMMPLYLFCILECMKGVNNPGRIVLVLLTLLVPFEHPFIVLFALLIIVFHLFVGRFNGYFDRGKLSILNLYILIMGFSTWLLYQGILMIYSKKSYQHFISAATEPVYLETTQKLSKASMGMTDLFTYANYYYGRYYLPTIIILISIVFIIRNRAKVMGTFKKAYSYAILLYLVLIGIEFVLFFNPIISHQPDRLSNLNFIVYAQVPLFSFALYALFIRGRPGLRGVMAVLAILTLIWGISLYGCFDSPNISRPNAALTYNEVTGMDWFYGVKGDVELGAPFSQLYRFHDLQGEKGVVDPEYYLPNHLGYSNDSMDFGQNILKKGDKMDVILLTYDELLYQQVPGYKSIGRFNADDFERFRHDTSADKVYDDLNIQIYNIK